MDMINKKNRLIQIYRRKYNNIMKMIKRMNKNFRLIYRASKYLYKQ